LYLVRNIVRFTTKAGGERNKDLHPCGIRVVQITEFRGLFRRGQIPMQVSQALLYGIHGRAAKRGKGKRVTEL
jgi:hypothetical protein